MLIFFEDVDIIKKKAEEKMALKDNIYRLRHDSGMTQAKFAEKFGVSYQSVQKWESGEAKPDLENIIKISKAYGITLDALLFDSNKRLEEELHRNKKIVPSYDQMHSWELYFEQLETEYRQCTEEGLDVEDYADLFTCVSRLPRGAHKKAIADVIFDIVNNASVKEDYPYDEPSDYESIRKMTSPMELAPLNMEKDALKEKIAGAWYARISGCLLGKTVEGIKTDELIPMLKESGNYPMHRYILRTDITDEMIEKYKFRFASRCYADTVKNAPSDDDTNYTVLYQKVIDKYGRDFNSADVAKAWVDYQPKFAYCTAERVAFCNFVKGYLPPMSAVHKNPFREWIGAQIRADYFGYVNPGNPEAAAEMAYRDACISHTKNGIYGEMFAASMIAAAALSDDIMQIIAAGLSVVPSKSRLYENVSRIISMYNEGKSVYECVKDIHSRWDEYNAHDWCHTVSNAEIVVACLLYGGNDFARSICLAVQCGFDTDCNAATVGSVLGMKNGIRSIGKEWIEPLGGKLDTGIFGMTTVEIDALVEKTVKHLPF